MGLHPTPGRRALLFTAAAALLAFPCAALASHPAAPLFLTQANADATGLDGGVTSEGREIMLSTTSQSSTCNFGPYRLEFEVRPIAQAFTNLPTHFSGSMVKTACVQQQFPWTRITGLAESVSYKWQVREVNASNLTSSWVLFNGGGTAFTTGLAPANHLQFTSTAGAPTAGSCAGPSAVQLQNAGGAPVSVGSTTTIPVFQGSDLQPRVSFYSDSSCDAGIASTSMPAGSSTASFYWRTTTSGALTLGADIAGALWGLQGQTVNAGPPGSVLFVSSNPTNYVQTCSTVRTVELRDAYSNPSPVAVATPVALTSSSTTLTFYSDAACTTAVTSVPVPVGSAQASFYVRETAIGGQYIYATVGALPAASQYINTYAYTQIITAAQTRDAGQCSSLTTLQTQTGGLQPWVAPAGAYVYVTGQSGMSFYTDSACDAGLPSPVFMDGGTANIDFYWRSTLASPPYNPNNWSTYIYGYGNYITYYSLQYEIINPGPPLSLGFGTGAQTIVAGNCSPAVTARTYDTYGNFAPAGSNLTINLTSSSGTGRFYSDATCTTLITSVTIAAGGTSANFYWRDTTPGSPTLTMTNTAPGLVTATQVETVLPKLVFTSLAQNLVAGTCAAATTVQSQDGNNAGWNTATSRTINLSTNSPAGPFFSDAACSLAISNITMAAGTNTVTFYWRDTRAGSPTLTATSTGYASGSQLQTITPGPPAQLRITTAAQTVGAGSCSAITNVRQEDQYSNATTQAAARTVTLLSTSATTGFFSASNCTGAISSLSLAAGASTVSFYWKDTTAPQTLTLTARSTQAPALLDATQVETVSVGAATRLAITSAPQTVVAGSCSGAATVGSQDASGNASNVTTATSVSLSSSTGTTVFYAGAGCTGAAVTSVMLSAGTSSTTFSWTETTAGTTTLTPAAAGFTGTGQDQTISAGTGFQLAFSTAAQSITAGTCSAATTVGVTDSYGNSSPVGAATAVALTSTSATMTFYSDAACGTAVTSRTISAGTAATTFYFRDLFTGNPTITAASTGLISGTQVENIGGREQVAFRWYSSSGTALGAEGVAVQAVPGTQLHLRVGVRAIGFPWKLLSGDAVPTSEVYGNVETRTGSYLNLALADGSVEGLTETRVGQGSPSNRWYTLGNPADPGWPFHAYGFASLPAGKTSYPLCLTGRTTGEALQVGYSFTASPNFTPTFPAGWQLTSASSTEVCFDLKPQGFNGGALTVYVQDALRAAGTDATADTFTLDQLTVRGDPPTYLALERSTVADFSSSVTQVLSAELWDDGLYTNGATLTPALSATNVAEVRVESRPSIPNNQTDVAVGQQGEWDFAIGFPSGGGSHYYRMVVTNSLGTKLNALEVTTLAARADTAATKLVFATAPLSVVAGACSGPLRVQAQDPAGNPRAQTSVRSVSLTSSAPSGTFYSDAACGSAIITTTIPAGATDATFYWRDTVVGSPVLTASSIGLTSATQTETVNPGPPANVAFTSAAQSVSVGACSAPAVVQVRDAYGNTSPVLAATSGPLSSTSGTTLFYLNAACSGGAVTSLTVPAGASTATFYFKDTVAGSPTISYSPAGLGTATQVETFSVGLPTRLAIITLPVTLTAGQCSGAVLGAGSVVQAQDSFGNPANVSTNIAVGLAADSGTLRFYSDAACTLAIASKTILAPSNSTNFYFRDTAAGTPTVTATAAGLGPATQLETIIPAAPSVLAITSAAQSVVAGACSGALAVRTQDAYGNTSAEPSTTLLPLTSSDAPVMRFYSDPACAIAISSATVASGTSSAQLYFRDTLAGSPQLTVSGPGLTSASQVETIRPAPTAGLTMAGFPSPSTAGVSGTFTLAAVDLYGNTAQDYAGSVQFSSSDSRATLPPVTSFSPGTGLRSFSATLVTAGTQSLTVLDNGVPQLGASQAGISVVAAAASGLQVSGIPSPVTSGSAHDVTVSAADLFGNQATGYQGTVRFTSTDSTATLPGNYTFTPADQGRRTFTGGITLRAAGTHTITATDTVTGAVTGQQTGVVVLQAQGGPCTGDGECSTGYCVGTVCCDSSCAGTCNSCTLLGRVGTCSIVADGTGCTNGVYCDGLETCQAGSCSPGAAVACVDPAGYDLLTCDEPSKGCVVVPNAPPSIVPDASPTGAPGTAYAYNARGRVTALGGRPMTFSTCAPLPGFLVDRLTGVVSWTPPATGVYTACVGAQNAQGQTQYTFQVNVVVPSGGPPVAAFTATPDTGEAPLLASFDGSASTGDPSALPLLWRWDFGDFSPLGDGKLVSSQYLLAGGYQAELTAFDAAGRSGSVKHPLRVLDRGRRPPSAKILAASLQADTSLSASFACDCQVGDAPLRGYFWELGDLGTASTNVASATFLPGRYRVRLTVLDGNGLTATDSVEVVVTRGGLQPPECRVGLSPPAGPAPLTVVHRATFGDDDGSVTSSAFTFSDGATSTEAEPTRTYDKPGRFRTTLKVTDDSGLTCVDLVQVAAIGPTGEPPPGFLSAPTTTGLCGVAYQYSDQGRPMVSGNGPIQFSLAGVAGGAVPDGMTVDPDTGAIRWTPSSKNAGDNLVVLRATSADGVAEQVVNVTITCGETANLSLGCTCSEAGGASWIAVGAGLLLLSRMRRARRRREA